MSKNIFFKLFICSIFIIILSNIFCLPISHAIGKIFSDGQDFLSEGKKIEQTIDVEELEDTSNYIYNILLSIAIMVAIIVAMILGIQFMAASADEKAKVKEAFLPFVVGCIVVFGAFTIWKIAVNVGNDAESDIAIPYEKAFHGRCVGSKIDKDGRCSVCGQIVKKEEIMWEND